jgi:hypothetical protein
MILEFFGDTKINFRARHETAGFGEFPGGPGNVLPNTRAFSPMLQKKWAGRMSFQPEVWRGVARRGG